MPLLLGPLLLGILVGLNLLFNLLHHGVDGRLLHKGLAVGLDDHNLHVLGTGIHHLEQALDGELDGRLLVHAVLVVLLEEFSQGLGIPPADDLGPPAAVRAGRVGLVQDGLADVALGGGVGEAGEEGGDAKGPDSAALGVLLLRSGDVAGHVLDAGSVLAGEAVGLGLDAGLVDEDTGVGGEAGKGQDGPVVHRHNLADRSGVLKSVGVGVKWMRRKFDEKYIYVMGAFEGWIANCRA